MRLKTDNVCGAPWRTNGQEGGRLELLLRKVLQRNKEDPRGEETAGEDSFGYR